MPLLNFLNQTATVFEKNIVKVWWDETIVTNNIYIWIKCYYFKDKQSVWDTDISVNTDKSKYKVMIEPNRTNTRLWQYITISDSDIWTIWTFLIEWVKVNRLYDWTNEAITLNIKRI